VIPAKSNSGVNSQPGKREKQNAIRKELVDVPRCGVAGGPSSGCSGAKVSARRGGPTLEQEAQSGFMVSGECTFGGTGISAQLCEVDAIYTVPAGRTAVLESFSGFCSTDTETALIEFELALTAPGGTSVMQRIAPVSATPYNGTIVHDAALNLKSYAYGGVSGSPISFTGFANADQDAHAACVFTLTGHLE
jgi:hypothetical protein